MKDLAIKAVATSAAGFYYREEHEWRGLDANMSAWFTAQLGELNDRIGKAGNNGGDITATFDSTIDGSAQKPLVVNGVTRQEMSQFQRAFHNVGDQLISLGEKHAHGHGKHK